MGRRLSGGSVRGAPWGGWAVARLVALVAAVLLVVADTPSAARPESCTPRWHVVLHSNALSLSDVVAFSPTDVWGTGPGGLGLLRPSVVHWDGHALRRQVLVPVRGSLDAIAALSPHDAWAVGSTSGPLLRPLAAHWNGVRWIVVPTPLAGREAVLSGIATIATDDAWAVGSSFSSAGVTRPLLIHWNGSRWGTADLAGIRPPSSSLDAVDARSPADVWAVGTRNVDSSASGWTDLVLHWDGHRWREVASPLAQAATGPTPQAVDVAPWGDVWTVNSYADAWFVRWIGHARATSRLYTPDLGETFGMDIAAVSPRSVWMVGEYSSEYPVVAHWNGTAWQVQPTPFQHLKNTTLNGLSVRSATDIWGAGDHLLVRYSC